MWHNEATMKKYLLEKIQLTDNPHFCALKFILLLAKVMLPSGCFMSEHGKDIKAGPSWKMWDFSDGQT